MRTARAVWPLLRAGQVVAGAQAALAGVLFAAGFRPADELFWLYGLLPVAIGFVAEQLRIASAEQVLENRDLPDAQRRRRALPESEQRSVVLAVVRREIGVMALAALVVAFLALRAALIALTAVASRSVRVMTNVYFSCGEVDFEYAAAWSA